MKCNLALHIMIYMLRWTVGEVDSEFKLSQYRKENRIPYTTFHRHLNTLLKNGVVKKIGRDNYRISEAFLEICSNYEYELSDKVSDNQIDMFQEYPF